jgi:peptide/nickel transport system permease protein
MLKIVGRRLLIAIPTILFVSLLVFVMIDLVPGDPALRIAGPDATTERVEEVRTNLRLDDPVLVRYSRWLGDAVTGDLGTSLQTDQPVTTAIGDRLGPTISLVVGSLLIAVFVGGALGIAAAVRDGKAVDRGITVLSSLAIAVPSFWLGLVLVQQFAIERHWFPAVGYEPFGDGAIPWLKSLVLPAIALAAIPAAETTLQLKGAMADRLRRDYVLTAEAKGMSRAKVVGKHTLKNAAIPVITVLGFRLAQLIGGAVIIERVFNIPGLGSLVVSSVLTGDVPVLLGVVVLTTLVVLLINLLVDISYGYFNPRIRG